MTKMKKMSSSSAMLFFTLAYALITGQCALAEPSATDKKITILIYGDSIGAGYGVALDQTWASILQKKLDEIGHYRVINASFTGETTKGGLARLPKQLSQHKPDLVLLELGGNDGLQGGSIAMMRDRLSKMVDLIQSSGAKVILLGMRIPPNYGSRYTEAFHDSFIQISQQKNIPLLDFFLEGIGGNSRYMQRDGIHPNTAAQPLLVKNIWPLLIQVLTDAKLKAPLQQ